MSLVLATLLSLQSATDWKLQSRLPRDGRDLATRSIDTLPARVLAPPGQLTLFADFEDVREGGIALYLVNRTEEEVCVPNQDGAPYSKLMGRTPDGKWERAETHHWGICSASYDWWARLPSAHYTAWLGSYPSTGEPRTVRWRIHSTLDVVSNEGPGFVDPALVERARRDALAPGFATWGELVELAMDSTLPPAGVASLRSKAITQLKRFPNAATVEILRRLLYDDDPAARAGACNTLGILAEVARAAVPDLKLLRGDPDEYVRMQARQALADILPFQVRLTLPLGEPASGAEFWFERHPSSTWESAERWKRYIEGDVRAYPLLFERRFADSNGWLEIPKLYRDFLGPVGGCGAESRYQSLVGGTLLARHGSLWGVAMVGGPERPLELELTAQTDLDVRVVDSRGDPVPGVAVSLGQRFHPHWRTETGTDGVARFDRIGLEVPVLPLPFVAVEAPLASLVDRVVDPHAPPGEPIELTLPPVGSLTLQVLDPEGNPRTDDGFVYVKVPYEVASSVGESTELRYFKVRMRRGRASFPHISPGPELPLSVWFDCGEVLHGALAPPARPGEHVERVLVSPW